MGSRKRITTDMNKPELLAEAQDLEEDYDLLAEEAEMANAEISRLQDLLEEEEKRADDAVALLAEASATISELTDQTEALEKRGAELVREKEELEERVLEAQQGDGECACNAMRRPSTRAAVRSLQKFDMEGGLPHLRRAERMVRAEISRLRA